MVYERLSDLLVLNVQSEESFIIDLNDAVNKCGQVLIVNRKTFSVFFANIKI